MVNEATLPQALPPSGEEHWWDTPEGKEEVERIQAEVAAETALSDPVLQWMHGVLFFSRSSGRGKRKRRYSKEIILLQFNGDREKGCWRMWTGEDRNDHGRNPWDEWATEVFGRNRCIQLSLQGIRADDYLRRHVMKLLSQNGGKF